MLMRRQSLSQLRRQAGAALLEILVSLLIVTFGLLALAGLQTRMNAAQLEAYQRSQAIVIVADMTQRVAANQNDAANYVTASALGTGETPAAATVQGCEDVTGATRAAKDRCQWSLSLQGAAEVSGTISVGAMIGARGCIEQIQAANAAANICTPAIYRVSVAWQGMNATLAPTVSCGSGQYGDETLRKVVSQRVTVPLQACS